MITPDIVPTSGSTTAKSSGDLFRPTASFLESRATRVHKMSEHDRSKAIAPQDHLAEQFRQLKILRAKVRQAEAELLRKPGKGTDPQQRREIEIDGLAGSTRSRTTPTKRN